MKRAWIVVLVAALTVTGVIGVPALSVAQEAHSATLSARKEIPVCSSGGSGTFEATIRADETAIDFTLTYQNLLGNPNVAHIHFGQRFVAGGISVFLCGGDNKPACPPSPGTVTGTIVAGDVIGPTPQGINPGEFNKLLDAIRAGLTYANVHTPSPPGPGCPGGDVRGQISR
jgi:hypothetical protein